MDALATVRSEVEELIRRSGLDPMRDEAATRKLVRDAVADYDARSLHGGMPFLDDVDSVAREVWDSVAGFGPLQKYLDDPEIEEIWINQPTRVFVARGGVSELTSTVLTRDEVRDLVERMLKQFQIAQLDHRARGTPPAPPGWPLRLVRFPGKQQGRGRFRHSVIWMPS